MTKYVYPIKFDTYCEEHGLTLRDHFAGIAMAQLVDTGYILFKNLAEDAYAIADAMLEVKGNE